MGEGRVEAAMRGEVRPFRSGSIEKAAGIDFGQSVPRAANFAHLPEFGSVYGLTFVAENTEHFASRKAEVTFASFKTTLKAASAICSV